MDETRIYINVYSNSCDRVVDLIQSAENVMGRFAVSYFNIMDPPPPMKHVGSLIIIEETSAPDILKRHEKILESYYYKPAFVVVSQKPTVESAVLWMKAGAEDYIDIRKKYTAEQIVSIIEGSLFSDGLVFADDETVDNNPFRHPPVLVNRKSDWDNLEKNQNHEMTLMLVNIHLPEEQKGKISQENQEEMIATLKGFFLKSVRNFGGKELFWNYNSGVFIFIQDTRMNCAALAAISILNRMKIVCFESLKFKENISLQIFLHDGSVPYKPEETKFITSDAINSVVHLQKYSGVLDCIDITENVHQYLNPRIRKLFYPAHSVEGRKIFSYYYHFSGTGREK